MASAVDPAGVRGRRSNLPGDLAAWMAAIGFSFSCSPGQAPRRHPKPDEPEPMGLVYATWLNLSSDGGRYEPVSDGTLRQPDRRCAVLLRPCGDHRHGAGDLLRRGDDAVSVCQGYPHFRLPSLC